MKVEFKTIVPLGDGTILFITTDGVTFIGTRHVNKIVLTRIEMEVQ